MRPPNHTEQADLFAAARMRRDAGIAEAVDHAEAESPDWKAAAAELLRQFARERRAAGRNFLAEDFVAFAGLSGLADPPDRRAFGHVIRAASRRGEIEKAGYAPSRSSNLSPMTLWK